MLAPISETIWSTKLFFGIVSLLDTPTKFLNFSHAHTLKVVLGPLRQLVEA